MAPEQYNISRRSLLTMLSAISVSGLVLGSSSAYAQDRKVVTMVLANENQGILSFVNTASQTSSSLVTEGLLDFDFDLNPMPLLATEWEVSEDGLTYQFKLRQGVKWHDGNDFTSRDVKFSLETSKRLHPRNRATLSHVSEIETPDEHTVILRLTQPIPYLLRALSSMESPIVPSHLYKEGDDALTNNNNVAPIGTGPYVFKEWVRGSHVMWEKNPAYWNPGLPRVDALVAKIIQDAAARVVAFETGSVDIGYRTPVPYREVDRIAGLPHIALETRGYEYDTPNMILLETNLRDQYLSNKLVRQAIAHTIDRDKLNQLVFFNKAAPTATPVVPKLAEFHLTDPSPYPYDLAAAEKLLDEAGYPRGSSNTRFTLTLDYIGDENRVVGEFIRGALSRIGVGIELRGQDFGTLVSRVYKDREFQLMVVGLGNLFDPQVGVQRLYWSKNIVQGVAFSNGSGYSNPEVDQLLEASAVELDTAKRVDMWKQVQKIIMQDVPNFPLVMAPWVTISNKRIGDHTTTALGFEGSFAQAQIVS